MATLSALRRNHRKFVNYLVEFSCGLDEQLVEAVVIYAESLQNGDENGIEENICTEQLSYQFNLTNSFMINLIFNAVKKVKRSQSKILSVEEFCKLVCIFLTPDLDLKINFVFSVYDVDSDGFLNRNEVYSMLKPTFPSEDEEHDEFIKDLIELVMKVVDKDNSGSIDLEEFRELVKKDVLYIELLGQCLPEEKDVKRFKLKVANKTSLELKDMFEMEMSATITGVFRGPQPAGYYPITLDIYN